MYQNKKFHYLTSFDIIKLGDVEIILVEKYPCTDKNELHARETYWIEKLKDITVNKVNPFSNWTKEEKTEYSHAYHEDNKTRINERKRMKFDCDCGGKYTHTVRERHNSSQMHQNYIKTHESKNIIISKKCFEFLFICDSLMKMPRTYPNYILT